MNKAKQPSKDSVRRHITEDICPFCKAPEPEQGEADINLAESIDTIYLNYNCTACDSAWSTIFRAVGILPSHTTYPNAEPFDDVYLSNWGVTAKHPA